MVNDLYQSFDKNIPSVLVLLDLSAAFDTVDHDKLLEILARDWNRGCGSIMVQVISERENAESKNW